MEGGQGDDDDDDDEGVGLVGVLYGLLILLVWVLVLCLERSMLLTR